MKNKLLLTLLALTCVLCCVFALVACDNDSTVRVNDVTLNKNSLTMDAGEEETLVAKIWPDNATNKHVEWSSNNPFVAIVDNNGKVTAKAEGEAVIYAVAENGNGASCDVTVNRNFELTIDKTSLTLENGDDKQFSQAKLRVASSYYLEDKEKEINWSVAPQGIVEITHTDSIDRFADCLLEAKAQGVATVTMSIGKQSVSCVVTVIKAKIRVESISMDYSLSTNMLEGDQQTLTVNIMPDNADDKTVAWSVEPAGIVTVDNGVVTAVAEGEATVTATVSDKKASLKIQVKKVALGFSLTNDKTGYAVSCGTMGGKTEIVIPSEHEGLPVTEIAYRAFWLCGSIESITIPNSVTNIASDAFNGCSSLASVTIGDGVTTIGYYVFKGCSSLTKITLGNSVTSIGGEAFSGCSSLASISVPDCGTLFGNNAFEDCDSLQFNEYDNALYLGNSNNPYVTLIRAKNTDITECAINSGTKVIDNKAFRDCNSLTSVVIPDRASIHDLHPTGNSCIF